MVRSGGPESWAVPSADVATVGAALEGLPVDLTVVGATGIGVDEATSAATGRVVGRTVPVEPCDPEPCDCPGCVVRDGLGAADGDDDGEADDDGEVDGVAVGDVEGDDVALGAGEVGDGDGDGAADEPVGDGLGAADEAADAGAAVVVVLDAAAGATVAAAAIGVPAQQMTALATPAPTAARMNRLLRAPARAPTSAPAGASSAVSA